MTFRVSIFFPTAKKHISVKFMKFLIVTSAHQLCVFLRVEQPDKWCPQEKYILTKAFFVVLRNIFSNVYIALLQKLISRYAQGGNQNSKFGYGGRFQTVFRRADIYEKMFLSTTAKP